MPVQINEIIVRAVVDPRPATAGSESGLDCPPSGNSGNDADIIEKVMEIIREKNER